MRNQGTSTRCQKWRRKHIGNSRACVAGTAQHQLASGNDPGLESVPQLQINPQIVAHSPAARSNKQRTMVPTICLVLPDQKQEQGKVAILVCPPYFILFTVFPQVPTLPEKFAGHQLLINK